MSEEYTKQEKMFLDRGIIKLKKEVQRQRDLTNLVVGSSWMTVPVYSEVRKINEEKQELEIEDEWGVTYTISIDDFLVRNTFHT